MDEQGHGNNADNQSQNGENDLQPPVAASDAVVVVLVLVLGDKDLVLISIIASTPWKRLQNLLADSLTLSLDVEVKTVGGVDLSSRAGSTSWRLWGVVWELLAVYGCHVCWWLNCRCGREDEVEVEYKVEFGVSR